MHAEDQVQQFVCAKACRRGPRNPRQTRSVQRCEKPPFRVLKFNWDAAVDKKEGKMGIGVIVRDHNGAILQHYGHRDPILLILQLLKWWLHG